MHMWYSLCLSRYKITSRDIVALSYVLLLLLTSRCWNGPDSFAIIVCLLRRSVILQFPASSFGKINGGCTHGCEMSGSDNREPLQQRWH